ncbi:MAG: hypothetical protein IJ689_05960 [Alphaproteobacteria bacterium]|nr:hypothetical protein [Alphaproteobacteria bacterium]
MTNKTFLTILLLGFSYTAYNAAAVSENFAILTIIDHEIVLGNFRSSAADGNLNKTGDISLGTIYINPNATQETNWSYSTSGVCILHNGDAITRADNATIGTFTANVSNPNECNGDNINCAGLSVTGNLGRWITSLFGGSGTSCQFRIYYSGDFNIFKVFPYWCRIDEGAVSGVTTGTHTGTLTISYTPS